MDYYLGIGQYNVVLCIIFKIVALKRAVYKLLLRRLVLLESETLGLLFSLLGKEYCLDIGQHTSLGDRNAGE